MTAGPPILSYEHCSHGLCGAHLLRELTFVVESNGYRWAVNLKRLLQETCARVAKSDSKHLSAAEYSKLRKHYRSLLTRGTKRLSEHSRTTIEFRIQGWSTWPVSFTTSRSIINIWERKVMNETPEVQKTMERINALPRGDGPIGACLRYFDGLYQAVSAEPRK